MKILLFPFKSIFYALMGKLSLQCQRCEKEETVESSPSTQLPPCSNCKQKTDWNYSRHAIEILKFKGLA